MKDFIRFAVGLFDALAPVALMVWALVVQQLGGQWLHLALLAIFLELSRSKA